ncbi:MAG: hypothetical protein M3Q29_25785 [Chloroflexota bacterium]|nr:hypothetical protein [Chloroflexota bacterium]
MGKSTSTKRSTRKSTVKAVPAPQVYDPAEAHRQAVKRHAEARKAAMDRLITAHKDEWTAIFEEEKEARGIVSREAQREAAAERKLADLLAQFPHLKGEGGMSDHWTDDYGQPARAEERGAVGKDRVVMLAVADRPRTTSRTRQTRRRRRTSQAWRTRCAGPATARSRLPCMRSSPRTGTVLVERRMRT